MGRKRAKPKKCVAPDSIEEKEQFEPAVLAEVESLYTRHFPYASAGREEWHLPPVQKWLPGNTFTDIHLEPFKRELNEVKSSLSDLDINEWQEHTCATFRAGLVTRHLRRHRRPELCTQAWCKFHEVLHSFPLLPEPHLARDLNSVHLCEAPGAFVASLNHYVITRGYKCPWQWLATTLNPYYEGNSPSAMITEDSFIRETLDHWLFGPDDTGDITSIHNIRHLQEKASEIAPVTLVTADGSIDCQNNPADQEGSTSLLHLAEVTAALHILSPGGSFVLKMFTLFESSSFSILYLVNCCFEKVWVCKPATSKSGNSEVYVVCTGFRGTSHEQLQKLQYALVEQETTLFALHDFPEDFLALHRQCAQLFTKLQLQTMEENKRLYGNLSGEVLRKIEAVRRCCALSFVKRFDVRVIPHWQMVVDSKKEKFHRSWRGKGTRVLRHVGSYNSRQMELALSWEDQVLRMEPYAISEIPPLIYETKEPLKDEALALWFPVTGKPVSVIRSSKFCDPSVLQRYMFLTQHAKGHHSGVGPNPWDLSAALNSMSSDGSDDFMGEEMDQATIPIFSWDEQLETNPLFNHLKEIYSEKLTLVTCSTRGDFGKVLIVPEIRENAAEKNAAHLVHQLIRLLQKAEEDDSCVFPIYEGVSRFSAGVIYTFLSLFRKTLVARSSSGMLPYFLLGQSFLRPSNDLGNILSELQVRLTNSTVLQFVPIHVLCESNFRGFLSQVNNESLKIASNALLTQQKDLIRNLSDCQPLAVEMLDKCLVK